MPALSNAKRKAQDAASAKSAKNQRPAEVPAVTEFEKCKKLQTCTETIASLQATQHEMNSRMELLRQDNIRMETLVESLKVDLANAEDAKTKLEALLSGSQRDQLLQTQRCDLLEKNLSEANAATKDIKERCNTIDADLKQTQAQYKQSQTILTETREALGAANILVSTHLSALRNVESLHQAAAQNLERAELKQTELTTKFNESEASRCKEQALQSSYDTLLQENRNANVSLQSLRQANTRKETLVESLKVDLANAEDAKTKLEALLSGSQRDIVLQTQRCDLLEKNLSEANAATKDIKTSLELKLQNLTRAEFEKRESLIEQLNLSTLLLREMRTSASGKDDDLQVPHFASPSNSN
jgi:hypothetical protein